MYVKDFKIFNVYFKLCIIFKIDYFISVQRFKNFCNISMYLSFVMDFPADGQITSRNT
jgi:hypothetical protein